MSIKKIINKTNNTILAERAEIADTPFRRIKGLLGRKALKEGEGIVITRCSSIHTFFMRFSIDVAFLDRHNRIMAMANSLPPARLFSSLFKGKIAIELPAGTLRKTGTKLGNLVEIGQE